MVISNYPGYMAGADSSRLVAGQTQQDLSVRIGLVALPWVTDSLLEDLTISIESALSEHAAEIAPGASASANFADRAIELDFSITATPTKVHQVAGEVLAIAMDAINQREQRTAVSFESSATSPARVAA
jgi:hypothetical protein